MNNDTDLYQELNLRKRQPINLILNLFGRELGTNSSTLYTVNFFNDYSNKNEQTRNNLIKQLYLCINPNFTILNVKIPNCYLRRFSPDGRYLIAFNQNLNGIQIFSFCGSSAGIDNIHQINLNRFQHSSDSIYRNIIPNDKSDLNDPASQAFKEIAFDTYFKEIANLRLTENNELIHRECALFYKNSYIIVASSVIVNEENLPPHDHLASNNEALHYNVVENYTIYLVDIKRAVLCDKIKFQADKINLTHNQSLSLFKNVFCVFSQQNQIIHVYNIVQTSLADEQKTICYKFVLIKQLGRFCFSDDLDLVQNQLKLETLQATSLKVKSKLSNLKQNRRQARFSSLPSQKGFTENCYTGMKHRILSYFFKEAIENNTLDQFYLNLNSILKLRMYKMQLLDDRYMIIKYVNMDQMVSQKTSVTIQNRSIVNPVVQNTTNTPSTSNNQNPQNIIQQNTTQNSDTNANTTSITNIPIILNENTVLFYFVLFDFKLGTILNILKNTSSDLLNLFENLQDYFSLATLDGFSVENEQEPYGSTFNFHTLASNNIYANQLFKRYVKNMLKLNNNTEMTKCLLSQLPISSQSYTTTPYLDHSLFSYDEKLISNLERPKPIGDQIIKFNMRDTGRLCFRLYPGLQLPNNTPSQNNQQPPFYKRLVAFIWHPREPFCISVQRTTQEYNVNFHVYSKINLI